MKRVQMADTIRENDRPRGVMVEGWADPTFQRAEVSHVAYLDGSGPVPVETVDKYRRGWAAQLACQV